MSDETDAVEAEPTADAPAEEPAVEVPVADGGEPVAQEAVVEEPAGEAPAVEAPVADAGEPVAQEAVVDEPVAEAPVPAEVAAAELPRVRQARVFLCERGHRVTALWSVPEVCEGRITRHGPVCGRPLYPLGALPEQVQRALNPLKASKKSSKKK